MGGFDVIVKDGVEKIERNNVRLGCHNHRISNMKKLAGIINARHAT